ncbi:hypothetical protein [Guptibacillus hwajinpoensis]|uniref:hypothetical protein n=1 Tax=Guptibacillus hwajinpoensis TaxID=208199 RepID=UPI0024B35B90|nr:hypothetical protein [Pseudalkalibacillus hwajinpoensis]
MIFYTYNSEFDEETLESIRSENIAKLQLQPSSHSIVYLFEEKEQNVGYVWIETFEEYVEAVEFFYKGNEKKRWGLYEFIVQLAYKQKKQRIIMSIPNSEYGMTFVKKWEGEIRERDGKDLHIEIPFLSYSDS